MTKKPTKRGSLGRPDKLFVAKFHQTMTPAEMATKLGRGEKAVRAELERIGVLQPELAVPAPEPPLVAAEPEPEPEPEPDNTSKDALRRSAAWKQVRQELLPDEVRYFEEQYEELMSQFRDDVLASERIQVFKVIRMAIFMNRNAKKQRDLTVQAHDTEKRLAYLAKKVRDGADLSEFELALEANLKAELGVITAELSDLVNGYTKLEDKHQGLMEELKATRKQRVDRIETGKIDFLMVLRSIATDDRVRQDSERQIELNRLTYAKEVVRLAKPHRFADGSIHQPLLNSDTVGMFPEYVPPLPGQQGEGGA